MLFKTDCGEQFPLFVYGTLRIGQPNHAAILRGHIQQAHRATLANIDLYSLGSYPLAVPGTRTLTGEVFTLSRGVYCTLLERLDMLEGYDPADPNGLFVRVSREVQTETGQSVRAWVYLGNPNYLQLSRDRLIEHGDWLRYQQERRQPKSPQQPQQATGEEASSKPPTATNVQQENNPS